MRVSRAERRSVWLEAARFTRGIKGYLYSLTLIQKPNYTQEMESKVESLDELDCRMLEVMVGNARVTWSELSKSLGISAPAVAERARKLEARGVILGYHTILEPDLVEAGLLAFIAVTLTNQTERRAFLERVRASRAILECHHMTGDDDFLLKVRVADTRALESLLTDDLKHHAPSIKTRTTIALSSLKEQPLGVPSSADPKAER